MCHSLILATVSAKDSWLEMMKECCLVMCWVETASGLMGVLWQSGDSVRFNHERQQHWKHSVCKLTCDSHVSVVFAFVYGVHDLLRTAHKTLSTSLGTHSHYKEMLCSLSLQQGVFTKRLYCWITSRIMVLKRDLWRENDFRNSSSQYF